MKPEQLKQIITIVVEGLEQKIEGLSSEISTVKKSIPNVDRVLSKLKVKQPIYGKDWKLTREEIDQIAEKIKPIAGRDFKIPKDGKDAVITDELITRIAKMVQKTVKNGEKGDKGDRGEDGIDGIDGSPDDPETIVDKLNMTEGGVDWKVLKNFDSLVNQDTLKSAVHTLENQTRYLLQKNSSGLTSVAHDATLTGDGTSGNPLSVVSTGGTPASPDTSIQFNDGGVFGGDSAFVWNKTTDTLTISTTDFYSPTNGSIVIGEAAGNHTMTGEDNLIIGGNSDGFEGTGQSLTTGEENIFIGKGAGRLMTAASRNVFIGSGAGTSTGIGGLVSDNVVIGRGTGNFLGASAKGDGNVLIGVGTGTGVNANYVVAIGYQNLGSCTADGVIAIGFSALSSNTTGVNIGIGDSVGDSITTGSGNILIGSIAGSALAAGADNNTIIGWQAGSLGSLNEKCVFVGSAAGANNNGTANVAIGTYAMNSQSSGTSIEVSNSVAIGDFALSELIDGNGSLVAVGTSAGISVTSGDNLTLIGAFTDVTTGTETDSIALGVGATITGNNQMVVGSNTSPITTIFFGNGVTNSTPQDVVITGTAGTGINTAGANLTIIGGTSTGNVDGGYVTIATSAAGASGTGANTAQEVLVFDANGNMRAARLHNNNTAQGSAAEQDIRSGTYTPTLTAVTNVTASTARQCQWMRVGNVVTVSGQCDIDPTGTGTVVLGISLPVSSNFTTAYQCGGAGHAPTVAGHGAAIYADATNNRAELSYVDGIGSNDTMTFTFTYEVI